MRYGYIGLGHLGGQLARSLLRAGFPLTCMIATARPRIR
jgi:3-hydroxyisobutyrate dehydrogenase-like beta-hydroxyacid dehydrogenase